MVIIPEVNSTKDNIINVESTKTVPGRGRPKSKPASKPAIFHLSLELIALIENEANEKMLGNKSALLNKILTDYFSMSKE